MAHTGIPWVGSIRPIYHFWTISYTDGAVPLDVDPDGNFAGFSNCLTPPWTWPVRCLGEMGVNMDGAACCGTSGACCFGDEPCEQMSDWDCINAGGVFVGGPCLPDPCSDRAACCVNEIDCFVFTQHQCHLADGVWMPEVSSCLPNPCHPTATDEKSWGTIKARFH